MFLSEFLLYLLMFPNCTNVFGDTGGKGSNLDTEVAGHTRLWPGWKTGIDKNTPCACCRRQKLDIARAGFHSFHLNPVFSGIFRREDAHSVGMFVRSICTMNRPVRWNLRGTGIYLNWEYELNMFPLKTRVNNYLPYIPTISDTAQVRCRNHPNYAMCSIYPLDKSRLQIDTVSDNKSVII